MSTERAGSGFQPGNAVAGTMRGEPPARTRSALRGKPTQEAIVLLVTLALIGIFSLLLPRFATVANLLTMARGVAVLGVLALGMGIVVIGRGLDLSQVAVMAVSTAFSLQLMQSGVSLPAALLAGLVFSVLFGLLNGFLIAFVEVPALFTTLATGLLVFGLARTFLLGGMITYLPADIPGLAWVGQGRLLGIPVPILGFLAAALVVHLLLSRTAFGAFIYSHGDNPDTAQLTGVAVRPLTMFEYVVSAAIAFLAGLVMAASTASMNTQIINSSYIFDVILVVVIGGISLVGGRGSVLSVIAGTLLIGTLLNGMTIMDLNNSVQNIIKGFVLLSSIILDNRLHPRDEETARQGD